MFAALVRPIVPCSQQFQYRNKMEFNFSMQRWQPPEAEVHKPGLPGHEHRQMQGSGQRHQLHQGSSGGSISTLSSRSSSSSRAASSSGFSLGLFKPGSNQAVLPITECHLQPGIANELLTLVGQLCKQAGLQPYDPRTRRGLLQAVVIRTATGARTSSTSSPSTSSHSTSTSGGGGGSSPSEVMLNFVTARDGRRELSRLVQAIVEQVGKARGSDWHHLHMLPRLSVLLVGGSEGSKLRAAQSALLIAGFARRGC